MYCFSSPVDLAMLVCFDEVYFCRSDALQNINSYTCYTELLCCMAIIIIIVSIINYTVCINHASLASILVMHGLNCGYVH